RHRRQRGGDPRSGEGLTATFAPLIPSGRHGRQALLLATFNSGIYQFFLFLHILSAIVGFGSVVLNGVYAVQARQRPGREGLAIFQANEFVTMRIAEFAIYAVFVFGLITAILGDPYIKFSQAWLSIAMALYIVGIAIS